MNHAAWLIHLGVLDVGHDIQNRHQLHESAYRDRRWPDRHQRCGSLDDNIPPLENSETWDWLFLHPWGRQATPVDVPLLVSSLIGRIGHDFFSFLYGVLFSTSHTIISVSYGDLLLILELF